MTTALAVRLGGRGGAAGARAVAAFVVCGSLLVAVAAGELVAHDRGALVLALVGVLIPIVLWQKPSLAPVLLVAVALTIEQYPEIAAPGAAGATARIPIFHGMGGVRLSDLLLALTVAIYVAKRGTGVVREWPRSPMTCALGAFLATVAVGVGLGVATGGSVAVALAEVRPFVYLGLAYLVASTAITTRRAVRAVLWAFVLGSGLKAFQGIYIFLSVRHLSPRPEAVLGHEESLFFALFVLLTIALWLYAVPGLLRRTATTLLPVVVAADLANGRRTAWLILAVGLVVVIAAGMVSLPNRRGFLQRLAVAILLVSAVYFPAYWDKTGGLAQPARAFHSAISPGPRDAASNLYRLQEEENLRLNIRQAGPLGKGLGHPINYALPIEDISDIDPYIAYVPHNGVLYLILRLGILGSIAFWALIGIAIIAACRLARSPDRELAIVGMLLACAVPSYVLLGYNDQGFYYYRVAFVMGALLGLAEACGHLRPRFSQVASTPAEAAVRRPRPPRVEAPTLRPAPVADVHLAFAFPAGRRVRRWRVVAATTGLLVSALLLLILISGKPDRTDGAPPVPAASREPLGVSPTSGSPAIAIESAADRVEMRPQAPPTEQTRLAVTGIRQGSWLQVRSGSATGPVVHEGVIAEGSTRRFRGTRLWVRFGAAANLAVAVNGKPVPLFGTVDVTFAAPGARLR